jgi:hypothetical protein
MILEPLHVLVPNWTSNSQIQYVLFYYKILKNIAVINFSNSNFGYHWNPWMGLFPQKIDLFFLAYFIRIAKRNNFVEENFSIRTLFRRENSIWKFKNNGRSFFLLPKRKERVVLL